MKLRFYLRGLGIGIAITAVILHFAYGNRDNTMTDEEVRARALELGMIENTLLSENGNSVSASDVVSENETEDSGEIVSSNEAGENLEADAGNASGEEPGNSSDSTENADAAENADDADNPGNTENLDDAENPDNEGGLGSTEDGDNNEAADTQENGNADDNSEEETPADSENSNDDEEDTNGEGNTGAGTTGNNLGEVMITVYGGDGSDTVARRLEEAGVVASAAEYDAFLCANGYDKRICTGEHRIPAGATYEEIAVILTTRN